MSRISTQVIHWFSFCLLYLSCALIQAQPQSLTKIESFYGESMAHTVVGSHLFVYPTDNFHPKDIYQIKLETGQSQAIGLVVSDLDQSDEVKQVVQDEGGIYLLSSAYNSDGNTITYTLHYLDTLGQQRILKKFDQSQGAGLPRNAGVHHGYYYLSARNGNTHEVWRFGREAFDAEVIYQSNFQILSIHSLEDGLAFFLKAPNGMEAIRYEETLGASSWFNIPHQWNQYSTWDYLGGENGYYFYQFTTGLEEAALWRGDIAGGTAETWVDSMNARNIYLDGEGNYLLWGNRDRFDMLRYWKGKVMEKGQIAQLKQSSDFGLEQVELISIGSPKYVWTGSYKYGYEWGYVDENDSLSLVGDLAPGPPSPLRCESLVYAGLRNLCEGETVISADGRLYSLMSNRGDEHFYVYELNGTELRSLFRLAEGQGFGQPFVYEEKLYWLNREEESLELLFFDLETGNRDIQPQPGSQALPSFHKQLMIGYENYYSVNQIELYYPRMVDMRPNGEITASFVTVYGAWERVLVGEGTDLSRPVKGNALVVRYDSLGNLLWHNEVGGLNNGYSSTNNSVTVDSNGDVLVFGTYFGKANFDQDSLTTSRSGNYLTKIDGETGFVKWQKPLMTSFYTNDIEIDQHLVTDDEGRIYISFLYKNFGVRLNQFVLSSPVSASNALACFSPEGELLWARNTTTPWTDRWGKTRVFAYDSSRQELLSIQSQGFYNTWSSCEFREWDYFLQRFDLEGNLLDTLSMVGSDLGGLVDGEFGEDGRLTMLGYHRGEFDAGPFEFSSGKGGDGCENTEGFLLEFDPSIRAFTNAATFAGPTFFPMATKNHGDHTYILGSLEGDLTLFKLSLNKEFIGYISLDQDVNVFDFDNYNYLDVNDKYIAILSKDFQRNDELGIYPHLAGYSTIDLLRIPNANWKTDLESFQSLKIEVGEKEAEFMAYPNPFVDRVKIVLNEKAEGFEFYEFLGIDGKLIKKGELNGDLTQEIFVGDVVPGIYLLRLSGERGETGVKVVKQP